MNNTTQPEAPNQEIDFDGFQAITELKLGIIKVVRNLMSDGLFTKENAIEDLKSLLLLTIEHEDIFTGALITEQEEQTKNRLDAATLASTR